MAKIHLLTRYLYGLRKSDMITKYLLALFFCLFSVSLGACKEDKDKPKSKIVRPVLAMRIGEANAFGTRKFSGEARASESTILAFEVSGKLNDVTLNVGDHVKKGSVLASLDSRDFANALASAEAEEVRTRMRYQRVKKAARLNAVSKQELTDAHAAYEAAVADVKVKRKAKQDAVLTAPYAASVAEVYVSGFENVTAKQRIVKLVDSRHIEMVVDIPENLIQYANRHIDVLVEFDALPGVTVPARITEIGVEADKVTGTYPVTLLMDQLPGDKIKPGMSGKAWGKKPPEKALENNHFVDVPLTALAPGKNGLSYVWIVDPNSHKVTRRDITKTGEMTERGILVEGLSSGEIIAVAGAQTLKEGQEVRIKWLSEAGE